jgi:anti-sigma factor RsiW
MNCSELQECIDPFLDNEVDLTTAQKIQRHLDECAGCEGCFASRLALRHCLQTPQLRLVPMADLRARIHAQLQKEIYPPSTHCNWLPRFQFPNWMLPTLAGAAAVLIFWFGSAPFLSQLRSSSRANGALIEQLVSNHRRSLAADHLFDVASSDQHTVKPWFAGKLNFSPPVFDFSDQAFKLIGGRLDYLGNEEVAAVIYQHQNHYINLFVWPGNQSSPLPDTIFQREGLNLYGWEANGLTFWAVTDASPETLKTFVDLEKQRMGK